LSAPDAAKSGSYLGRIRALNAPATYSAAAAPNPKTAQSHTPTTTLARSVTPQAYTTTPPTKATTSLNEAATAAPTTNSQVKNPYIWRWIGNGSKKKGYPST
jgi:hypothetical protein